MPDTNDPFVRLEACLTADQRRQEMVEDIVDVMCETEELTVEISDVEDAVRAGLDTLDRREDLDIDVEIGEVSPEIADSIRGRYESGQREFDMGKWIDRPRFIGDLTVVLPDTGDEYAITEEVTCDADVVSTEEEIEELSLVDSFLDAACTDGEAGEMFDQLR